MFSTIKTAALSALIGLGALAAIPATAQADGLYLEFDGHHRGDDWRRERDWRRSCSPDRALDKAERMGIRHARVVDVGRRTIKVSGRKYNDRVTVVFGNERGCPIIYR